MGGGGWGLGFSIEQRFPMPGAFGESRSVERCSISAMRLMNGISDGVPVNKYIDHGVVG